MRGHAPVFIRFTQVNPVIQADRLQSPTKETLNVSVSLGTLILLLHSLAKLNITFLIYIYRISAVTAGASMAGG